MYYDVLLMFAAVACRAKLVGVGLEERRVISLKADKYNGAMPHEVGLKMHVCRHL